MNKKQNQALTILSELSGRDTDSIEPKMELVADLGIDSPKAFQLLMDIEDRLGVEISDEDAAQLETVNDVLQYLGSPA